MSESFELCAHDADSRAENVERLRAYALKASAVMDRLHVFSRCVTVSFARAMDDAYGRRWRSDYLEVE